jgi:hypothetical protein
MVFTAVARALDRSLAMGASGVASKPTSSARIGSEVPELLAAHQRPSARKGQRHRDNGSQRPRPVAIDLVGELISLIEQRGHNQVKARIGVAFRPASAASRWRYWPPPSSASPDRRWSWPRRPLHSRAQVQLDQRLGNRLLAGQIDAVDPVGLQRLKICWPAAAR